MSWDSYIEPLKDCSVASAIISFQGADCAHQGDWKASTSETIQLAKVVKDCHAPGPKFNYGGKEFKVAKVTSDFIIAHGGMEGLFFSKSNTLIIAAEYKFSNDRDVLESVLSGKVYPIAEKLRDVGY